jgi:hypothetical protein
MFLGLISQWPILPLICFYRFLIGVRSSDCGGHESSLTPYLSKYALTIFALCHGALSSCITTYGLCFALIRQ